MAYHAAMGQCFKCGAELPPADTIFRATLCESCGSEVRCCRNCGFYSPGAHWDCRETISEPVREKDRANFCDHFRPATATIAHPLDGDRSETARDAFNSLFDD